MIESVVPVTPTISPALLLEKVGRYVSPADGEAIRRAFEYAYEAHDGQSRESGDPYITHPLAVAETLADLQLDGATIMAALLHDVAEDTDVTIGELEARFGAEVSRLVDGVTKLSRVPWFQENGESAPPIDRQTIQNESMRKMFLAMADDIRVVLIKLADRLHNMQTLDARPPEKRRRVAQETMDIYAPLANRLGIGQIKWQLEDLAFRQLEPGIYKDIAKQLQSRRVERERAIAQRHQRPRRRPQEGWYPRRDYRPTEAHLQHLQEDARPQRRHLADLRPAGRPRAGRDAAGVLQRARTGSLALAADPRPVRRLHRQPEGERLPVAAHDGVVGERKGSRFEIQIRTYEMHQMAEYGVAAHWRYKEGRRRRCAFDAKVAWLRSSWTGSATSRPDRRSSSTRSRRDVFQDQVYVFTPRGEIKEMPAGATPLDFAYRVHTEVGHKCVGAKVNGRMVPLDHKLQNGDIVEIITARGSKGPSRDWLNPNLGYIHTANAREKIRQWFRKQQRDENVQRGRELVDEELKRCRSTA